MLSITGGTLKGKRFTIPASWPIRPTTALARQAFFQRIDTQIVGCRFLDLFTGSGLMALEAHSRGAAKVIAVDSNRQHCQRLINQLTTWHVPVQVVHRATEKYLQSPPENPFDVIFLDPPYAFNRWLLVLPLLTAWVHADSHIVIEHDKHLNLSVGETRWYGNTGLTWLNKPSLLLAVKSLNPDQT